MRIISKSRDHFHATHKGCTISIERERDPDVPPFYIIVTAPNGGYLYEGWAPASVLTMADAKREALYGSTLKTRPSSRDRP
jgi:hypothetical protein